MRAPDLLLLAGALAGIVGLSVAPAWLDPPLVALRDLPAHDGEAVTVEARVVRSSPAGSGAQVLTLADGTREASALWADRNPWDGAWLRIAGAVDHQGNRWGLRPFRVEVLATSEVPLDPDQAARLAPVLKGQEVAVLGTLVVPEDGEPHLRGAGARLPLGIAVPIADHGGGAAPQAGQRVLARGTMIYDAERACYLLQAWEVARV